MQLKKVLWLALLVSPAWSTPLTIVNPGFEADVLPVQGFTIGFSSGWTVLSGVAGAFHPNVGQFPTGAPEGNNTAFINNGGTISQVLSDTLAAFTAYTLTIDVGQRLDDFIGAYQIQLLAGGVLLAQDNNTLIPPMGTFQISTIFFASGNGPQVGQQLEIRLIGIGIGQPNFDAVSLDAASSAIPEPGTVSLLAIGLGLLGSRFARRRLVR